MAATCWPILLLQPGLSARWLNKAYLTFPLDRCAGKPHRVLRQCPTVHTVATFRSAQHGTNRRQARCVCSHQIQREYTDYYYSYGDTENNVWLLGECKVAHWNGQHFVEKRGPHYEGIVGILAVNPQATWAWGENGALYRWTIESTIESVLPNRDQLMGFWATDDADTYATTYEGITYRWNGQEWQKDGEIAGDIITGLWGDGERLWGINAIGERRTLRGQ